MTTTITATVLVGGRASGTTLVLDEPVSFWGGVDSPTGTIREPRHPQLGEVLAGRILVMPHGRGSSSASSVLAEMITGGTGPLAIITRERDPILALGSIVATELSPDLTCPVLCVGNDYPILVAARHIVVDGPSLVLEQYDETRPADS